MKPVAIFQHDKTQRPGYLLKFLEDRGIPTRILAPMEGDAAPQRAEAFCGLVMLGSNLSVNNPLPWNFQCHLEVTEDIVREWCQDGARDLREQPIAAVQQEAQMLFGLPQRVAALHKVAHSVYVRWMAGLPQPQVARYRGGW